MKTLIFQTSPPNTASTFLVNALYGLIPELNNKRIIGIWDENWEKEFDDIIVIKCHSHNTDIDELINKYKDKYNLYFICSDRTEKNLVINDKYKLYENVFLFSFSELNETITNNLFTILNNIHNKIKHIFTIKLNISTGITRIIEMNKRYEEIKLLPFDYIDDFYEIHGSHRNNARLSS